MVLFRGIVAVLRMTKQADYGIVLLTRMAGEPDRLFTTGDIAGEVGLPQPIVGKILKRLAREGLLASQRGVKGGYSLSRDPVKISMVDIITALEGPIAITECVDDSPGECSQEADCALRGNWQRINQAIREALENISLAEMTQPHGPELVHLGSAGAELR